jgi:cytochrome o ubiquinol oxidase subunit I
MGATRRLDNYDASTGWQPLYIMMFIGGVIIMIGVALQVAQILASVIERKKLADTTGDPWDGRTLEWSVSSPPPAYNMAIIPEVKSAEAWYDIKKQGGPSAPKYEPIVMPKYTGYGIYISAFAFLASFAFVWEMTLFIIIGIVGIIVCSIIRCFDEKYEYVLPVGEVEKIEAKAKKRAETPQLAPGEEMGLIEFVKQFILICFNFVRFKQWQK